MASEVWATSSPSGSMIQPHPPKRCPLESTPLRVDNDESESQIRRLLPTNILRFSRDNLQRYHLRVVSRSVSGWARLGVIQAGEAIVPLFVSEAGMVLLTGEPFTAVE